MHLKYKILSLLVLSGVLIMCCSSWVEMHIYQDAKTPRFISYHEIPGVSKEEKETIEAIIRKRRSFIFAMPLSSECFYREDGSIGGFAALFCERLEEFFGIPFELQIRDQETLKAGLNSHEISFSSALPNTLSEEYFMIDVVAERTINFVSLKGKQNLAVIAEERPLNYAFLEYSDIANRVKPFIQLPFHGILIKDFETAKQMLQSGEIDGFFDDNTITALFDEKCGFIVEPFSPVLHNPVTFATKDSSLRPLISMFRKYLNVDGQMPIREIYIEGKKDYLKHKLLLQLTEEERSFLTERQNSGVPISVLMNYDNYPISFYNKYGKTWQGSSADILREITKLTGLSFEVKNEPTDESDRLITMLENGEAAMITELMHTKSREGRFLWTDLPYQEDYYVLISKNDKPEVSLSQVMRSRVGIIKGTAYEDLFTEMFPDHQSINRYEKISDAIIALERGEIELLMATRNLLLNTTVYLDKTGFKVNLNLERQCAYGFGFNKNETILRSIINKAQKYVETDNIVIDWTSRLFDYRSSTMSVRMPILVGVIILMSAILSLLTVLLIRNRRMDQGIESLVEERTMDLKIQTEKAQVASRAKGDYLARMSHEIRTPLNAIMGMTEIVKKSSSPEKTASSLDIISTASSHLLEVVNDVLDLSKIEAGKFVLVHEPFMLHVALDEVVNIICTRCEEKNIHFDTSFDIPSECGVVGDKVRLKQVIINLLGNAIKFTAEDGDIRLHVSAEKTFEETLSISVEVEDTGIGIPDDQIVRLFEDFEQADPNIFSNFGGTGLGLSISQKLVKQMGGEILVDSVIGQGTCFSFTIVLEKSRNITKELEQNDIIPDFHEKTILLVEDVEINRMMLIELLADTHINIHEAVDGEDAVNIFSNSPERYYDLIFMDVQMPNMDGYEATRHIRALPRRDAKGVPIIAMTANAYKEDIDRALASGMNDHVSKPIDMNRVLHILSQRLGSSSVRTNVSFILPERYPSRSIDV